MREEEEDATKKEEDNNVDIRRLEAKEEATEDAGVAHIRDRGVAPVVESCASETQRDAIHAPLREAVRGEADSGGDCVSPVCGMQFRTERALKDRVWSFANRDGHPKRAVQWEWYPNWGTW